MKLIVSFFCGLLFGIGLYISQMVNPQKVINFLDIAGSWDPSLMFVMGAGLLTFGLGYFFLIKKSTKPVLAEQFSIPERRLINKPLILGSIMFGAGWGLTGICPGPAMANILSFEPKIFVFILMMLTGMFSAKLILKSSFKSKLNEADTQQLTTMKVAKTD